MITEIILAEIGKVVNKEEKVRNWDEYLINSQLVGPPGAHSRENILKKINKFIEKQQKNGDGQYQLSLPKLNYQQVLDKVIEVCGICSDLEYIEGKDFVSLKAFKKYIPAAAQIANEVSQKGGTILLATGHPKSLLPAYSYIGRYLMNNGGVIYNLSIHPIHYDEQKRWLGTLCGVGVLFEGGEIKHTHNDCGLDKILKKIGKKPDLAIADHGIAAAAIRAGIPTIVIVDTNDVELTVAACIYSDRVFPIPMNDSAGPESSMAMAYYFEHLIKSRKE